ncbi:hypothetical protein ACQ4PT_051332 [Festuca glaucescens]
MATAGVAECGLSYAVVSIMGPQSSGKSTLLNQLFGTNFREMDAFRGRSQTTKGIWIAHCVGVEPCTVVLDLEGTDGRERGEDDTAFEKQSALFALAISDIVLINMWCHDIGREQAANKPLLKTVFQVMVATVRCDEIANEKFGCLASDAEWLELENAVQSGSVQGFGKKLGYIVDVHMQEYDKEAVYFDEAVRKAKRQVLESRILNLVQPAFHKVLSYLRSKALEKLKSDLNLSLESGKGFAASVRESTESSLNEFDQGCADAVIKQADWDYSKMLEKVRRDIEEHAFSICERKLSELTSRAKEKLRKALVEPVESLFDAASQTTWESIRNLYKRETEVILPEFLNTLSGFEMESAVSEGMVLKLRDYARSIVENKAKEEANKVLMHMKERFTTVFSHDKDSMPRVWTGKEDVRAIAKDARSAALKLMSMLAVIRWDDKPDRIENILISTLLDSPVESKSSSASSGDPLASTTWEEVPAKHTLITPAQCKSLWKQFKSETEFTITQAVTAQQAHRRANGGMPPLWAMVAIAILGFNEIMALLRNPMYLFLLFVGYLVAKALAVQLDIGREFQNGMIELNPIYVTL